MDKQFLALLAAFLLLTIDARSGDWPQFLGPNRNGHSNETGLWKRVPPELPKLDWSLPIGSGYAGPVVANNRLYVFHQVGEEESLECRATGDGSLLWRVAYACEYQGGMFKERGPRATPTIEAGVVISLGADGVLQAVETESGKLRWRRRLAVDFDIPQSYFGVSGSPAAANGLVFVNVGARSAGCVAFSLQDGKVVWKKTDDEASYASPIFMPINGKSAVVFFTRAGLRGFEPATGTELFYHPFRARMQASVNAATPIPVGDRLFVSASYNTGARLLEWTAASPNVVWKAESVLECHYNTCVYHDGFLFGIDGRQEGGAQLQCVEAATGKVKWTEKGFGCATATLAEGQLWLVGEDGVLTLVEASPIAFRKLWSMMLLDGPVRAQPALADGKFYVRGPDRIVRLNIRTQASTTTTPKGALR